MALKWGIAAAGSISNDFANALSTLSSDEHEIVAIAASNGERAKQFALRHGIQKSYEGYENLATDPDVGKLNQSKNKNPKKEDNKIMNFRRCLYWCLKPSTL